jgi:hypothetical protein
MIRFFILTAGFLGFQFAFAQSVPAVGVFIDFDSVPGSASVETMKKEVNSLLKGVTLNWRLLKENHGNETFSGLVVLRFKGSCKAEPWAQQPRQDGETWTMGATQVVNGRVTPFSEVQCDEVRRALSYLRPETSRRDRQKAFGLALGRVVAHELYHILAHTTAHAARGLAKAAESLDDLISDSIPLVFRPEDSTAIRRGLVPEKSPAAGATGSHPQFPLPPQ